MAETDTASLKPGSFYVAAIASSAGGLEALTEFLNHLPLTLPLAVVVAQHLSPTYKSHLVDLLAKETTWPVQEISSGLSLQVGQVYIIPPDADAVFEEGCFLLQRPQNSVGPKPSADVLFASLAAQTEFHGIGIVLSGTGSDGCRGLPAIKAAGGWCLVQEPNTARYNGMPLAALRSEAVDFILPPSKMGLQIQALIADPALVALQPELESEQESEVLEQSFYEILKLLTDKTGTDFSNYKPSTIMRRLQKRLYYSEQASLAAYLSWIQSHPQELDELFNSLLIGVTGFFRDPEAFTALTEALRPLLAAKQRGESLRIWVPGCASGEEAYSLAMLVHQLQTELKLNLQLQVFATDISESSIALGRRGIYPASSLVNLPESWRETYFVSREGEFEISKSLRSLVLFSRHDLTVNPPFLKLDLISCRNLLIYFGSALQKQILPIFHYALNPEGLLLLGKSETIGPFSELFLTLNNHFKLFQRRSQVLASPQIRFASFKPMQVPPLARPLSHKVEQALQGLLRDTLFETYEFPYVVINDALDVLQVLGDVSLYLSLAQGRISTHLLKLCHPELQMELRLLTTQALREGLPISGRFRRWPAAESSTLLRLKLIPVKQTRSEQGLLLVIFETLELDAQLLPPLTASDSPEYHQVKINELEYELAITREHLQSFVSDLETSNEELQALNEELQSTNEEFQSTNEELETANEELQSTNEEMQVAYTELRTAHEVLERKEQVLAQSQAKLTALLDNTLHSFVLLDKNYHVQAFNSQAQHMHNQFFQRFLTEGMPVLEAFDSQALVVLLPLMQQSLQTGVSLNHEYAVETETATHWITYHLRPIFADREQTEIVGLAISASDMTQQVQAQQEIEKSKALVESVFNATDSGICVTDQAGYFVNLNQGYCRIYGYVPEELLGKHFTLVSAPEQKSELTALHERFIAGATELPGEWQVQRKDGQFIDVFASAHLLVNPDGSRFKVTTVRDITESKKYRNLLTDTQHTTGVGGWELDLITSALSWTPEIYAIYQLPEDAPVDLARFEAPYPAEAQHSWRQALELAMTQGDAFDLELQFNQTSGHQIWVRITCKPVLVYEKPVKLFGTFQDITARKQTEDDKNNLIQELTQKNEHMKHFTYIISHNLRSPVANLLGLVNLLKLEDSGQAHELIEGIQHSAVKLDEVIQDLNQILAVRKQEQQTLYQHVDVQAELDELCQSLALAETYPELVLKHHLEVTELNTIRSYFQSILYNLISNAIKYASPERVPQVQIQTWRAGEFVYLSVQDNGMGFDAENQSQHLFRLYKRLHPQVQGKGLGLYLVKTQAEALGGGVEVKSEINQGACFTVYMQDHHV